MNNILVAFNSSPEDSSHGFFQGCADVVRQMCADRGFQCTSKTGEGLTEQVITCAMEEHSLCVIAAHGSFDSIVDENGNDVISTRTTNYVFSGKGVYAVSCRCARDLMPELCRMGALLFIGYNDELRFSGEDSVFVDCALSGLRSFIGGNNLAQAKVDMLSSFDQAIENAENSTNPFEKMFLLHDKESLVFYGAPELQFTDLS